MNKLKLVKDNEVTVTIEKTCYCDFCGDGKDNAGDEEEISVFTSSFEDRPDNRTDLANMQICFNCVKQLFKLIP